MAEVHEFTTPRNLFEKLIRDSEKIDEKLNGDNIFNFMVTAYHIHDWIKKAPLSGSEVVNRFLKRLSKDENIKLCKGISNGTLTLELKTGTKLDEPALIISGTNYNPLLVKNEIMELYSVYFRVKGH